MPRLLLIDDDPALLDAVTLLFEQAGHEVRQERDGEAGLQAVAAWKPDVVVSDVNMPRLDGFGLCRRLRERGDRVPVLLLTSREGEIDEALGLDLGADDFLRKPFSNRVLLARVAALLRRSEPASAGDPVVRRGRLELDPHRLLARLGDKPLSLTVTEFRLLHALAAQPGVVLSRDQLLTLSRGHDSMATDRIVDTYVSRIRRKLQQADPAYAGLETVTGLGYRLAGEY